MTISLSAVSAVSDWYTSPGFEKEAEEDHMLSGARLVRLLGPDCTVLAAHGGFCFGAALVGTKEGINLLRLKYTLGCPYPGQPRHCFIIDFIQHNAGAGGGCSVLLTRARYTSAQWQSKSAGSTYLLSTSRDSSASVHPATGTCDRL